MIGLYGIGELVSFSDYTGVKETHIFHSDGFTVYTANGKIKSTNGRCTVEWKEILNYDARLTASIMAMKNELKK